MPKVGYIDMFNVSYSNLILSLPFFMTHKTMLFGGPVPLSLLLATVTKRPSPILAEWSD